MSAMSKICPQPNVWNERHKAMTRIAQERGLSSPPKPLILAGWAHSEDWEKKQRWQETVDWCKQHSCAELTDDIANADWYLAS
jgi:hypothetical protein